MGSVLFGSVPAPWFKEVVPTFFLIPYLVWGELLSKFCHFHPPAFYGVLTLSLSFLILHNLRPWLWVFEDFTRFFRLFLNEISLLLNNWLSTISPFRSSQVVLSLTFLGFELTPSFQGQMISRTKDVYFRSTHPWSCLELSGGSRRMDSPVFFHRSSLANSSYLSLDSAPPVFLDAFPSVFFRSSLFSLARKYGILNFLSPLVPPRLHPSLSFDPLSSIFLFRPRHGRDLFPA